MCHIVTHMTFPPVSLLDEGWVNVGQCYISSSAKFLMGLIKSVKWAFCKNISVFLLFSFTLRSLNQDIHLKNKSMAWFQTAKTKAKLPKNDCISLLCFVKQNKKILSLENYTAYIYSKLTMQLQIIYYLWLSPVFTSTTVNKSVEIGHICNIKTIYIDFYSCFAIFCYLLFEYCTA